MKVLRHRIDFSSERIWSRIGIAVFIFLFFNVVTLAQPFSITNLSQNWKIEMLRPTPELQAAEINSDSGWISAQKMPAMVSDILLQNNQIEEPWLPGKAEEYQWIAENDWVYETTFKADLTSSDVFLNFKGLDGIVDIYLNNVKIGSHQNMFMPLRVNVSHQLKKNNKLQLHFHSIFAFENGERKPIKTYKNEPVRKPDQSFLNYLGPNPCFARVGVFDDITLEVTHGTELTETMAGASLDESLKNGVVSFNYKGLTNEKEIEIQSKLIDASGKIVSKAQQKVQITDSLFMGTIDMDLKNPELWWPRGYGNQYLYKAEMSLLVNNKIHQQITRTIGFRKIEMTDTLHFTINNRSIKLWGGCWVTPHMKTAVWDQQRAEQLFDMAENANFNIFRVWSVVEGPGDGFYDLANQRGILLWHDFTELPLSADEKSIEICKKEATYTIQRLKHNPSILLWCGGNENALWQHEEYNGKFDNRGAWGGIEAANAVEQICTKLDPERVFYPTTPYYGIDPNDPKHGNTHGYTNMWFVPGYDYLNFASEDTRIAAPVLQSLERFMAPEDIYPKNYSSVFTHNTIYTYPETWLKYTTSSSWKKTGPIEHYYDATDAASLVYRLGMAEAEYYRETVEKQRWGRPATDTSDERKCGGYMVWKFNDSWPQIYSAKVDYFLEPLHAYYTLKEAYSPIHISFEINSYIYLWVVNDSPEPVAGNIKIELWHIDRNEIRKEYTQSITLEPGKSKVAVRLDKVGIGSFKLQHVLFASLTNNSGEVIATTHKLADIERNISFPNAIVNAKIENNELVLSTDKFAKSITLTGDENGDRSGWFFSDNYFDLVPGEIKRVKILAKNKKGTIAIKAWYSENETIVKWDN